MWRSAPSHPLAGKDARRGGQMGRAGAQPCRLAWRFLSGSWVGRKASIDVSERIAGSADALAAGIIRGELAVWDIAARRVPTGVGGGGG